MALIGIYDWDFFHYKRCLPNLECGKLLAYYRNNNDIAVLTDKLEPSRYTKFFIRKDYEDGIYVKEMTEPNVELGGLAFSKTYIPLSEDIENTAPIFDDYAKYENYFASVHVDYSQLRQFLRGLHCRFSLDGKTINPNYKLQLCGQSPKNTALFIHDSNLFQIQNIEQELVDAELCTVSEKKKRIFHIKFVQYINQPQQLYTAALINYSANGAQVQYDGLMPDHILYDLAEHHLTFIKKFVYNPILTRDNFEAKTSKLLRQLLFLHNNLIEISLISDSFNIGAQDSEIITLLNVFIHCTNHGIYYKNSSVVSTIKTLKHFYESKNFDYNRFNLNFDKIRDIIKYTGENYYDLFVQFYEANKVIFQNGEFVYG